MLVTSSQSSTHRPLGLSVEELYALDHQYRRIEQQQQQQHHLAQLQAHAHLTSSNLNRLASRSLDLVPSMPSANQLSLLPSVQTRGHEYINRLKLLPSSLLNYPRSHSIDHLRYISPTSLPPHFPPLVLKHLYLQRPITGDIGHQYSIAKCRAHLQQPIISTDNTSLLNHNFAHDLSTPSTKSSDNRGSCKLRRQQPIKRESSRRIVVRPIVQRRREPSLSSSCESLDERRSSIHHSPIQSTISNQSVPFTPSTSLIENVTNDLAKDTNNLIRSLSYSDSLSDDNEVNLYEMRVPVGKTYDTSDISVQLEGLKVLIHCYTIEPTDKRGNYRKHEFKTELLVPDVVDDESIAAYLTENGQLIVEGKYHLWAWEEIKKTKLTKQEKLKVSSSSINTKFASAKDTAGDCKQDRISISNTLKDNRQANNNENRIEKLDNNRTIIHVGEPLQSQQNNNVRNVSDTINLFNVSNKSYPSNIGDGQYSFTNDFPPILIYHLRLPFETLKDKILIQSDPRWNLLQIFMKHKENCLLQEQTQNKMSVRSMPRVCQLPLDRTYDYSRLRVVFLEDNFIRIEIPTLN